MAESFLRNNVISAFLQWYFFDVPKEILNGWKNFLKFNLNYFSLPVLLKTLFSHWHKYSYSYGKRFDPWRYIEAFVFNMMSRTIGAVLRIFFIAVGFLIEILLIFAGLVVFLGWFLLPFILIGGFFYGFRLFF